MREIPKTEVHHWWPEAVSNFWADAEGQVNRIEANGDLVRSLPKSFGGRLLRCFTRFGLCRGV